MPDKLAIWAKEKFKPYFKSTATEDVIKEYKEIVQWVSENNYYSQAVKNEFASSDLSDSWLRVAFAKAQSKCLMTEKAQVRPRQKFLTTIYASSLMFLMLILFKCYAVWASF